MKYLAVILLLVSPVGQAKPLIVTSLRPLTMIVEALVGDDFEVRQLLGDSAEPHHYSLRVSDRMLLNKADLIIWIGPELESFLTHTVALENPEKVLTVTALADIELVAGQTKHDPHVWLNPRHGAVIADEVVTWLIAHYPAAGEKLRLNLRQFRARVNTVTAEISNHLQVADGRSVLVDHDAFGHFFAFFNIRQAGALKNTSGLSSGAKALNTILNDNEINCLVAEPHSSRARLKQVAKKLNAKTIVLDPLGANIRQSADAYPNLLKSIADALHDCLSSKPNDT